MATVRVRQRGKTFSYSFDAYTLDGKRKIVEKGGFSSKQIAYNEGVKAFAKYKGGDVRFSSKKINVAEFMHLWLEEKKCELKIKTASLYAYLINGIVEIIGEKKLQELRPYDVDLMVKTFYKKGYARETIRKYLRLLKDALNYAVYPAELISVNVALYIKVPRNAPINIIKRKVITKEKLDTLLEAFPFSHRLHIPILLGYHTGMRLGEILGLCWEDIDFKTKELRVERQLTYVGSVGHYFSTPKTLTSYRQILLDNQIISILKKWKALQIKNEIKLGKNYIYNYEGKNGELWGIPKVQEPEKDLILRKLVCTSESGAAVRRTSITNVMKKHGITFHDLRHTHATILMERNAIPKDVAVRLGHRDATITQNIYTHDTDKMKQNTVAIFEDFLKEN